jgi:hypothetical protein
LLECGPLRGSGFSVLDLGLTCKLVRRLESIKSHVDIMLK